MRHFGRSLRRKQSRLRSNLRNRTTLGHTSCHVEPLEVRALLAINTIYAVNTGGPEVIAPDSTVWEEDSTAVPSIYSNQSTAGSLTFTTGNPIDTSAIAAEIPPSIFSSERYGVGGVPMEWDFPVTAGNYEVRLYFSENYDGNWAVGARMFDVTIEGQLVLDNYDVFAQAGAETGIMESFIVSSDANLDIDFGSVAENPAIKGIEILEIIEPSVLNSSATALGFGDVLIDQTDDQQITLTNLGGVGDPAITISSTTITGSAAFTDDFNDVAGVVLAPGQSTTISVTFAPTTEGAAAATLEIAHSGANSPINVSLTGEGTEPQIGTSLIRINAGGPAIGNPEWAEDSASNPSPLSNSVAAISQTFATGTAIDMSDPSIPVGTPAALFQSERSDTIPGDPMEWDIPVTAGPYEVRLYFAEIFEGNASVGARIFDVSIEDQLVLDDYDIFEDVGAFAGVVKTFQVSSDGNLDIDFGQVVELPSIKAIEIVSLQESNALFVDAQAIEFGSIWTSSPTIRPITVTNAGFEGDPSITINSTTITGSTAFIDNFDDVNGAVLAPGESIVIGVTFAPDAEAAFQGVLEIQHSGQNNPVTVDLSGTGTDIAPVGFGKSILGGVAAPDSPTSLQWGPDGRLYVAFQDGTINIYSVVRNGSNDYSSTLDESITLVKDIPNHDDDGTPNPNVNDRLVTGIMIAGTAQSPIIYATSGDPRIGAGPDGEDLNLDTNSGTLSRLTWDGSQWSKVDLVRGLPRSEENHNVNGLVLDESTNTIYLTSSGNTNNGAPSFNFAYLAEYAYSTAILSVDMNVIDALPDLVDVNGTVYKYNLPTLDDEDRDFDGNGSDEDLANGYQDVFGGNDGKNQAYIDPNSPVQIYSPGYRNPYDIVLTQNGNLYTIDNGANAGWGDVPIIDPETGLATNEPNEPGETVLDNLHFISGPGYYGGHPNPTRANPDNTFNPTNPQSPIALVGGNAIESFFAVPQADTGSMAVFGSSTNGLTEYTASNFGGAMQGDLLTANYFGGNSITRLSPDETGAALDLNEVLFSNVGVAPLDVTAIGDNGPFPGTIWVVDWFTGDVIAFEPNDYEGGGGGPIDLNDLDGDGYTNDDEIANGTNPNSAADVPADNDLDFISDLLDDNDDNDALLDVEDPFAIDPDNGLTTTLGVAYGWENDEASPGGLLNLGFTGLMINGQDNYKDLFNIQNLTAGGAAGVLTLDLISEGDAIGLTNTQEQAFQFGVNVSGETTPFTAHTRILAPFAGINPEGDQSMGFFIGNGDQDNYIKFVVSANGGAGGLQTVSEVGGVVTGGTLTPMSLAGIGYIDLYLTVDPVALTVQASYSITSGGETGPQTTLGTPLSVPSAWLNGPTAMAVGVISTSVGPAPAFSSTWDFLNVLSDEVAEPGSLVVTPATVAPFSVEVGATGTQEITLSNVGDPGDADITILTTTIVGAAAFTDDFNDASIIVLAPGESTVITVAFAPTTVGQQNATIEIAHSGVNTPISLALTGTGTASSGGTSIIRINAGGPAVGTPEWSADSTASPSSFSNVAAAQSQAYTAGEAIDVSDPSIPAGTPASIFATERYDLIGGAEMQWDIPVTAGLYEVRLYFAETYAGNAVLGARVFDVLIENQLVLDNYDVFADVGGFTGVMKSFIVSSDGNLDIDFARVTENPALKGIEIVQIAETDTLSSSAASLNFSTVEIGETGTQQITLTHVGSLSDPDITISSTAITGSVAFTDDFDDINGVVLAPGESVVVTVSFDPTEAGLQTANLQVVHSGLNSPISIPLQGTGTTPSVGTSLIRINVGGPAVGTPEWSADSTATPSTFSNVAAAQSLTYTAGEAINVTDPSIPVGTPASIFSTERYDLIAGEEMQWDIPVTAGQYEVRLYFAETYGGNAVIGGRVFDVLIENQLVLDNYDVFADVGGFTGVMKSFIITSDTNLDIDFARVTENPALKGIEIIQITDSEESELGTSATALDFVGVEVGQTPTQQITLTNLGEVGDPSITIASTVITGSTAFTDDFDDINGIVLAPGESTVITVTFAPTVGGAAAADLTITYDGETSPLIIPLSGLANTVGSTSAALFEINPGNAINSSTFLASSFIIENLSPNGQNITSVQLNLSTAILPDMVFDPLGNAGDLTFKDLTADSSGPLVGLGTHSYSGAHDGGFDILTIPFSDFGPGESFEFSLDVDPTSITGVPSPGPQESGSVSGLELVGATVTIVFDDGSTHTAQVYRTPASNGASENIVRAETLAQPTVELVGTPYSPTLETSEVNQTVRITGPVGASVSLLMVESGLFTDGLPGGGFDIDPFETNTALGVQEFQATIGAGGFVDIPVTLMNTNANGGLNSLVAVIRDTDGHTGPLSPPLAVQVVEATSNTTPSVDSPIGSIEVTENDPSTTIDLTSVFSDVEDGTNLTFTVESNSNPTLVDASIVSGTLTLDYLANQTGTATIVVRATDSGGLFVEDTITVTVNPEIVVPSILLSTPGYYDPATAMFGLRSEFSAGPADVASFNFGMPGWIPIVGDWDGDGDDTVGLYNPTTATFYLNNGHDGTADIPAFNYGVPGWIPIAGDWDGDGIDTIGVFYPDAAVFFMRNSNDSGVADIALAYGGANWKPVVGDWDGDGIDTIGVFEPTAATWFLRNSNSAGSPDIAPFTYGGANWTPLVGDWNADGVDSIGIWNPASAEFYLRNTNGSGAPDIGPFVYGTPGNVPIVGNWVTAPEPLNLAAPTTSFSELAFATLSVEPTPTAVASEPAVPADLVFAEIDEEEVIVSEPQTTKPTTTKLSSTFVGPVPSSTTTEADDVEDSLAKSIMKTLRSRSSLNRVTDLVLKSLYK